jgi:hypothetical protein
MNHHSKGDSRAAKDDKPATVEEQGEEIAHLDDAVIGRAFRWSIIALVCAVVAGGAGFWLFKRKPAALTPKVTTISAPTLAQRPAAEIPLVKFTDVTAAAGLAFVHNNGAYGDKLLPETMGSGVAFFDFDNDGDQDLLFVNSTYWPWKIPADKKPTTAALYRNNGKGQFSDITAGSGLDVSFYGTGVAVGDYDNDGLVDVFISAVGENRLFHNDGHGKFSDVTARAGVAGAATKWSTACAWIDYDRDGDLDLFVGNYVRWSREIDFEVGYKLVGIGRAYGPPMNFEGTFPSLYRNDGNGRFTDVSAASGLQIKNPATGVPVAKTLGVAPVDLDGDGWIDLVIANDTVQNFVFHNERNGTFKEIGALAGIAFDSYGNTRGAMGIDAARYRNDDTLGIAIGNFANEMTALYVSQKNPLIFTDEAIPEGLGPASRLLLKFGLFFFDYDLDGRLDLLSANGHLEEEIGKIQQSQRYAQPAQLFWNSGAHSGATFMAVSEERCGREIFKPLVGRGSAFADIDGDGDLDLVLTQAGGAPLLLRNDQALGHHWLRLKLVGKQTNRDAIGAWVRLRLGDQTLSRQVMPTRSYLSQSELPITIGLGKARQFDELEVIWPDGTRQKVAGAQLDTVTLVEEAH